MLESIKMHKIAMPQPPTLGGGTKPAYVGHLKGMVDLRAAMRGAEGREHLDPSDNKRSKAFYGEFYGETVKETFRASMVGRKDLLAEVQKTQLDLGSWRSVEKVKAYDVQGGQVNVPLAYKGVPTCVVTRRKSEVAGKPLRIIHNLARAARVSTESIVNTGAAVLSVLEEIAHQRPITLTLFFGSSQMSKVNFLTLDIDCRTLERAQLAWLLVSPAVLRRVFFSLTDRYGEGKPTHSSIPSPWHENSNEAQDAWSAYFAQEAERAGGDALVTPSRYLDNVSKTEAMEWIARAVREQGAH